MSDIAAPALGILGLLVGSMLWTQFTRWIALLYVSGSRHGGDFLGPPRRRLIWAIPVLALLHPAPWLMCAAAILGFHTLQSNTAVVWRWFFAGLSLALLVTILSTLAVLVRSRRSS